MNPRFQMAATVTPRKHRPGLRLPPWPLPALLAWLLAWALDRGAAAAGAPRPLAQALAAATMVLAALLPGLGSAWRRGLIAAGYPLALCIAGAAAWPAWCWLAAMVALALAYPIKAWRDAPWFPTPAGALRGLSALVPLPPGARVVDAGCGIGDGLAALRREWPHARLEGVEWSWPLRLAAGARCRFARVHRGDMWALDWSPYALVYLFQRPESMSRAIAKAEREMAAGGWLASLAFEVPGRVPDAVLRRAGAPAVMVYRVGAAAAQPGRTGADNPRKAAACRHAY